MLVELSKQYIHHMLRTIIVLCPVCSKGGAGSRWRIAERTHAYTHTLPVFRRSMCHQGAHVCRACTHKRSCHAPQSENSVESHLEFRPFCCDAASSVYLCLLRSLPMVNVHPCRSCRHGHGWKGRRDGHVCVCVRMSHMRAHA